MTPETFREEFHGAVSDETPEEAPDNTPLTARLDEAERLLAEATAMLNAHGDGPVPPGDATSALLAFGIAQCHMSAVSTVAQLAIAGGIERIARALEQQS